jgi:hypothetical protein
VIRTCDNYPYVEFRSKAERAYEQSLDETYKFLEWAMDQNLTQPDNSMFKCNDWSNKEHTPGKEMCQEISEKVQSCWMYGRSKYILGFIRLVAAKCEGGISYVLII